MNLGRKLSASKKAEKVEKTVEKVLHHEFKGVPQAGKPPAIAKERPLPPLPPEAYIEQDATMQPLSGQHRIVPRIEEPSTMRNGRSRPRSQSFSHFKPSHKSEEDCSSIRVLNSFLEMDNRHDSKHSIGGSASRSRVEAKRVGQRDSNRERKKSESIQEVRRGRSNSNQHGQATVKFAAREGPRIVKPKEEKALGEKKKDKDEAAHRLEIRTPSVPPARACEKVLAESERHKHEIPLVLRAGLPETPRERQAHSKYHHQLAERIDPKVDGIKRADKAQCDVGERKSEMAPKLAQDQQCGPQGRKNDAGKPTQPLECYRLPVLTHSPAAATAPSTSLQAPTIQRTGTASKGEERKARGIRRSMSVSQLQDLAKQMKEMKGIDGGVRLVHAHVHSATDAGPAPRTVIAHNGAPANADAGLAPRALQTRAAAHLAAQTLRVRPSRVNLGPPPSASSGAAQQRNRSGSNVSDTQTQKVPIIERIANVANAVLRRRDSSIEDFKKTISCPVKYHTGGAMGLNRNQHHRLMVKSIINPEIELPYHIEAGKPVPPAAIPIPNDVLRKAAKEAEAKTADEHVSNPFNTVLTVSSHPAPITVSESRAAATDFSDKVQSPRPVVCASPPRYPPPTRPLPPAPVSPTPSSSFSTAAAVHKRDNESDFIDFDDEDEINHAENSLIPSPPGSTSDNYDSEDALCRHATPAEILRKVRAQEEEERARRERTHRDLTVNANSDAKESATLRGSREGVDVAKAVSMWEDMGKDKMKQKERKKEDSDSEKGSDESMSESRPDTRESGERMETRVSNPHPAYVPVLPAILPLNIKKKTSTALRPQAAA